MKNESYLIWATFLMAVATYITRVVSFVFLGRHQDNPRLNFIGRYLPPAVMIILVIYCLKSVNPRAYPYGLPEVLGVIIVAILHVSKRSSLLSIFGGSAAYLVLLKLI